MSSKELAMDDALTAIGIEIEKARVLVDEVQEEYFDRYDAGKNDEMWRILYDFKRSGVLNRIVQDILQTAAEVLLSVEQEAAEAVETVA